MDAAFVWGRNSRTYFFKGDKYWRYNGRKVDYGYPKSISVWKRLPANIDAAMKWRNGKTYFFTGSTYYRFDDWELQVEADYPKSIALKWMRCEKDNIGVITTTETPKCGTSAKYDPRIWVRSRSRALVWISGLPKSCHALFFTVSHF